MNIKHYENLTGKELKFEMYGTDVTITIPANAKAFPLDEAIAEILMGRTYVKILQEVTPIENPVVDIEYPEEVVEAIQETPKDPLDGKSKEELRLLCRKAGIDYSARETVHGLKSKLIKERVLNEHK